MSITRKEIKIEDIPAIIWGVSSRKVYLYIHGQGGNKDEACQIADIICKYGYQILSIDLPEHGDRKNELLSFDTWHIVPELTAVMKFAKEHWDGISLFANSIGAWFSMLSFSNECLDNCFFVSPVLDMRQLILKMMSLASITEEQLKQELIIHSTYGQTLSYRYWKFALSHPITKWDVFTKILYGENDNLIERDTIERFTHRFQCDLTVMDQGEHWFHTEEQLVFMRKWLNQGFINKESTEKER